MEDRGSVLERGTTDRGVDDKSRGLSGGFRLEANAPVSLTQEEYDYLVAHGSPREWKEWRKKELRAQMEESGPLLQQHEIKEFDPDAPPPSQIKEYKPPEPPRTRWEQFTRVNLLWLRNIGEAFFGPLQVAAKADLGEPITEEDRAWAAFDAVTFGGGRAKHVTGKPTARMKGLRRLKPRDTARIPAAGRGAKAARGPTAAAPRLRPSKVAEKVHIDDPKALQQMEEGLREAKRELEMAEAARKRAHAVRTGAPDPKPDEVVRTHQETIATRNKVKAYKKHLGDRVRQHPARVDDPAPGSRMERIMAKVYGEPLGHNVPAIDFARRLGEILSVIQLKTLTRNSKFLAGLKALASGRVGDRSIANYVDTMQRLLWNRYMGPAERTNKSDKWTRSLMNRWKKLKREDLVGLELPADWTDDSLEYTLHIAIEAEQFERWAEIEKAINKRVAAEWPPNARVEITFHPPSK